MQNEIKKGTLKRWNDDRGFGFISTENEKDIFIHMSAFKKKHLGYRPKVGDVIFYQIHTGNDGKTRAVNAKVEGIPESKPQPRLVPKKTQKPNSKKASHEAVQKWVAAILIVGIATFIYKTYIEESQQIPATSNIPVTPSQTTQTTTPQNDYTCEDKTHCSEMNSCREAKFYLKNCPNVKIDGDNDGVPCEMQWCN